MRQLSLLIAVGTLCLGTHAARGEAPMSQGPVPGSVFVGDPAPLDGVPRGGFVITGDLEPLPPPAIEHATPIIFFLNRFGGTYVPGTNDARTNRSTIVSQTRSIPAWNVSAAGWQQVMSCMTTMFQRWNVTITDVDPGNVPHYELVTAGRPQDLGMQSNVGGVSPFSCGVIQNSIVFTFAAIYGTDYRSVCETNAQEIAHSFGLDHEYKCQDPMTYLTGCGNKSFQNVNAQCGEYSPRSCMCGGSTQNSVTLLDQRLGLRETMPDIDAGVPVDAAVDAAPAGADAGVPPTPDAGAPSDPDAGANPSDPDGGVGSDEISGGCGCAGGSGDGTAPHVLLLAMAVLVGVGRRRRRTFAQPRTRT